MTVRDTLRQATRRLGSEGVETPHLDAMVLLAYCLGVEKETLFTEPERDVPATVQRAFDDAVEKRRAGTPVSYIRRRKEFFGRDFYVDERVLVPRPDTETMVETALEVIDAEAEPATVHDCCTGSGCIAITLKAERPDLTVSASDVSPGAVEVAKLNVTRLLGRGVSVRRADLLEGVTGCRIITANPPYVKRAEYLSLAEACWPEPAEALDGGADGLDVLRRLIPEAFDRLGPHGYFLCEIGYDQGEAAKNLAWECGFGSIRIVRDLGERDRVLLARR
jgi:release factor glutamine methyltransferase